MDKDRGTDCRGGAARHSAAWLPVIRTSCSLLFQAICVLSARIPAGTDELCFKKNVPVRSQLREDTCQDAAATQRNAGVGFSSFRFSFPGTLFPASGMSGDSRSLLFGQRAVCHAFAQATDGDEVKISTFGRLRAFSCSTWSAFSVSANSNTVTFRQMPARSMAASIPELPPPITATCLP